jgi:Flp pilus assembly protein TadD
VNVRLAALLVVCACSHAAAPATPSPSTAARSEIEQAETAEKARQHDVARVHYQRAVAEAHDPASVAFVRRAYGETLATWGEFPEALSQYEGSLTANPGDASAWHDVGLLRHKLGDTAGAIAALERARTLAPRDFRPRVALAALRWKTGDRAGATTEYRGLLELDLPERLRGKVQWALGELAKP